MLISLFLVFCGVQANDTSSCATINDQGEERPIRVLYFLPEGTEGSFWQLQKSFAEHVAQDLGIEIDMVPMQRRYQNRFSFIELMTQKVTSGKRPDYIVGIFYSNGEENLLSVIEKHKVPYFSINTSLEKKRLKMIGHPRERYKSWIGHMTPDDESAGYALMMTLARHYPINTVAAIAGAHQSNVSRNRVMGLRRAITDINRQPRASTDESKNVRVSLSDRVELLPVMNSDWSPQDSEKLTKSMLSRVGKVDGFWTAGVDIAKGVINATKQQDGDYRPIIGTFDWARDALNAIEAGDIQISLGGHFTEGGWTMVLLLDHANGIDFSQELGVHINTQLHPVTRHNVHQARHLLDNDTWASINFRSFSKCYNPQRTRYDLTLK